MIAAAILIAAAAPQSAIDAELTFAADAQSKGQWAAFRAHAATDGVMFVPEPVKAQQWLQGRKEPPVSVMWWPAQSWTSCDGTIAVNTGPWLRDGGRSAGYFTTVWQKQPDGRWQWLLDHGDSLDRPRSASDSPETRRASCRDLPASAGAPAGDGGGASADNSLRWRWNVHENGARIVWAEIWDGQAYRMIVEDKVEARGP